MFRIPHQQRKRIQPQAFAGCVRDRIGARTSPSPTSFLFCSIDVSCEAAALLPSHRHNQELKECVLPWGKAFEKFSVGDSGRFGPGPYTSPMTDPEGNGIYFVNGKSSGSLTAYHVHSMESTDIVSEDATQPIVSPDGKRLMYIALVAFHKTALWAADSRSTSWTTRESCLRTESRSCVPNRVTSFFKGG